MVRGAKAGIRRDGRWKCCQHVLATVRMAVVGSLSIVRCPHPKPKEPFALIKKESAMNDRNSRRESWRRWAWGRPRDDRRHTLEDSYRQAERLTIDRARRCDPAASVPGPTAPSFTTKWKSRSCSTLQSKSPFRRPGGKVALFEQNTPPISARNMPLGSPRNHRPVCGDGR